MENFRISQETYQYLCRKLQRVISHEDTTLCTAVSVKKCVAVTLWCLATCSEYRTIAHLFGLAEVLFVSLFMIRDAKVIYYISTWRTA